jgi:3',5'-cyclic AMP phosphodiesterase CpdA
MRIAAISDQHGFLPEIPPCDLLIVAGDVCPDALRGKLAWHEPELQKAWFDREIRPWLAASPATHKLLTWGNHDWCGERCRFDADADSRTLQILLAQETRIPPLRVWASPWSNQFGDWAFMREPRELAAVYDTIPTGIDILVSHQPPYGYCDEVPHFLTGRMTHQGSRELLAAIDRVKPKIVICGHIHEGHGTATHNGTPIYNVSVVDEHYRLVYPVTLIDL